MQLENYKTGETYQASVLSNVRITSAGATEEVRELVLEIERADFSYQIGQSVGVIIAGPFSTANPQDHAVELQHSHHFRLYTVADTPHIKDNGKPEIKICVKRCHYIDEFSGECYPGIASNFLCNLQPSQRVMINGPFGIAWTLPDDKNADLLMIGMGTGIAPFRAFVKQLYQQFGHWQGKVSLFLGARSGMELLYMNDEKNEFMQYSDQSTFETVKALSPRPHWDDPIAIENALNEKHEYLAKILASDTSCIYVVGRPDLLPRLEKVFSKVIGSMEKWEDVKSSLVKQRRWQELIY